jgi:hypothetical protein
MTNKELEAQLDYGLTTNQTAHIGRDAITIEICRGSYIRRNRTKMATLMFTRLEVIEGLQNDTFFDRVNAEEAALNLPLVPDEYNWQ